jgi:hypothetical protein
MSHVSVVAKFLRSVWACAVPDLSKRPQGLIMRTPLLDDKARQYLRQMSHFGHQAVELSRGAGRGPATQHVDQRRLHHLAADRGRPRSRRIFGSPTDRGRAGGGSMSTPMTATSG